MPYHEVHYTVTDCGCVVCGLSVLVIHGKNAVAIVQQSLLPRRLLHDVLVYGGAILLVRDPQKALVAEWHRERSNRRTNSTVSNHYLYEGKEYFGEVFIE